MTLTTLDFLRLVVPEQGTKFISADPGKGGWRDFAAGQTHESMAAAIGRFDGRPFNVYMALGGFVDAGGRKADRATHFRSLWLDLDVQKATGRSYESAEQALQAAKAFVRAAGLPKPNLLVSSGMGIHIYWCFSRDVTAAEWQPLADSLKALVQKHDLVADMAVITDKARVLRPIGTLWHDVKKGSAPSRPVRLVWANPQATYTYDELKATLRPQRVIDLDINDSLGSTNSTDSTKADPRKIAEQCGQMKKFSQTGNLEYEIWRLCIGVLSKCDPELGRKYAHEWSAKGYGNYSPEEVDNKLVGWNATGATLCSTFRNKDSDPNGPCTTCPVKCNSPISLGYDGGAKPVPFVNKERKTELFAPLTWPDTARIHNEGHVEIQYTPKPTKERPDPDPIWLKVANLPFYLNSIAVTADGSQESDVVFFPRPGQRREFVLPHATAQNSQNLKKALNSQGIFVDAHIEKFVVSYIDLLKKHVADTPTHTQMGWKDGGDFLLGDQLISADDQRTVRVNAHLKPKARLFDDSNDPKLWTHAVNRLYNLPGGQPYQFAICAPFASVLIPLLNAEEFNGVPIALTSDESGYGKSTVCKIALSAFGRVERNLNVLTGDEVSPGAVEVQCSTFNCVGHLFDEMTNKSGQETSHILYMLSNGVARARLKQDGTPRPPSPPWAGIAFITGNKNIFLKLTESRVNPEAAQMRVFEIPLENYGKVDSLLHASDFIELTNSVRSGFGGIGRQYLRFVMTHRQRIQKDLWELVNKISRTAGVRHDKERFYIYEIACVCYAARIMRHLGLVGFDPAELYHWSMNHMASMRTNANEYQRTTEEDFALMLATLVGQGKVIATLFVDRADNELPLRGAPVLRIDKVAHTAHLTHRGFLDYCRDAAKNPSKFRQELVDAGFMVATPVNYALGQGVSGLALGTSQCYPLNFDRAVGPVVAMVHNSENVVPMRKKEASL